jgi:hypothetical protein
VFPEAPGIRVLRDLLLLQPRRLEREFFIDNLLVRIHYITVIIRRTGLAPWEFDFLFPGSLTSTFLFYVHFSLNLVDRVARHEFYAQDCNTNLSTINS